MYIIKISKYFVLWSEPETLRSNLPKVVGERINFLYICDILCSSIAYSLFSYPNTFDHFPCVFFL